MMTAQVIHNNKKPKDKDKDNDKGLCKWLPLLSKAVETDNNIKLFESWSNVICNMEKIDFYKSS